MLWQQTRECLIKTDGCTNQGKEQYLKKKKGKKKKKEKKRKKRKEKRSYNEEYCNLMLRLIGLYSPPATIERLVWRSVSNSSTALEII